jgi:nucleoside-diphosphate-sugar epimerase
VRIVDADDREVPRGTVGEVVVRGPNVMLGYWNKPEQSAAALRGGWMHTGDGAYMDDDGFIFVVDRMKDMIISGGENVYSAEVENAITQHPAVAACAVIGIPSEPVGRDGARGGGAQARGRRHRRGPHRALQGADRALQVPAQCRVRGAAAAVGRGQGAEDHAARALLVAKVVYVSTVWALGSSGSSSAPSTPRDERWSGQGPYLSAYHRSKAEAHRVALRWRTQGLPVVTAMPHGVMGANDHSVFGYFLRLILLGRMPPMSFGGEAMYTLVDVHALAEGLCLAAEKAAPGADYLFCGPRQTLRELFERWGRLTGQRVPRWYLPRWFMRPQMAMLEPLQRLAGLPAFLSRDTVDATKVHLDYSSARAQRELGWTHPDIDAMWHPIIERERELMASRQGFLNKLRHVPVAETRQRVENAALQGAKA